MRDSAFCSRDVNDTIESAGISFQTTLGDFALEAYKACLQAGARDGVFLTYEDDGTGEFISGQIDNVTSGDPDWEISRVTVTLGESAESVDCGIEVPLQLDIPRYNFTCIKKGSGAARVDIFTTESSLPTIIFRSEEEVEQAEIRASESKILAELRAIERQTGRANEEVNILKQDVFQIGQRIDEAVRDYQRMGRNNQDGIQALRQMIQQ